MNRAAHQHGVLESFILRHSSPKILTKPPARIFAAYRFLFMICHVLETPLDQQETSNKYQSTNYQKLAHDTPKSKLPFLIKSALEQIAINSPFHQAAVVSPPAFLPHKTDTKLATGTETCMVHYVLHHTLIHSLTLSGIR